MDLNETALSGKEWLCRQASWVMAEMTQENT